jgi:hypothetical protein
MPELAFARVSGIAQVLTALIVGAPRVVDDAKRDELFLAGHALSPLAFDHAEIRAVHLRFMKRAAGRRSRVDDERWPVLGGKSLCRGFLE